MNNLVWLLYFANVSESLSTALSILSLFFVAWGLVLWVVDFDTRYDRFGYYTDKMRTGYTLGLPKQSKNLMIVAICCLTFASFLPSKETIYAIAASEVGEQILKTPLVSKAEKALEVWLDKQAQQ